MLECTARLTYAVPKREQKYYLWCCKFIVSLNRDDAATLTLPCARKHKVSVSNVSDALNGVALDGAANSKDNGTHKRLKLATKGKRVVGNLAVLNINLDTHGGQRASEFLARGDEDSGTLFGSNGRIHLNLVCSVNHDASILSRRLPGVLLVAADGFVGARLDDCGETSC